MWRFIDTGLKDSVWNMEFDEVLLKDFNDADLPILRIYRLIAFFISIFIPKCKKISTLVF